MKVKYNAECPQGMNHKREQWLQQNFFLVEGTGAQITEYTSIYFALFYNISIVK